MITIGILIFAAMIVPFLGFAIIEYLTKSRITALFVAAMMFLLMVVTLLAVISTQSTAGAPHFR